MTTSPDLSVVIPAHNEEQNLGPTVAGIQTRLTEADIDHELILVNDNSSDGTGDVIARLVASDDRVRSVTRVPPSGFGRAVRSGLDVACGEVVTICMADSSDDPADVVRYFQTMQQGFDCVFGSRFIRGSRVVNYPRGKLVANRLVNTLIRIMFRCPFNDLTNAFKAYRAEVIRACRPYQACHFNITIEMSLGALNRQFRVAQIPINWYGRTWGSSNLRLGQMGRRYLHTLIKAYGERVLIADDVLAESNLARDQTRPRTRVDGG
jgi:dolichol-phosphate mannosyltransferase